MTSEHQDSNLRLGFTAHASSRPGRCSEFPSQAVTPGWNGVGAAGLCAFGF